MLTLRSNRFAFAFAVVLLVVAPVASAFVCGSPMEDCCSSARIDHARLSSQAAPIAVVAETPGFAGITPVCRQLSVERAPAPVALVAPTAPLRI